MTTRTAEIIERVTALSTEDEHYEELLREIHKLASLAQVSLMTTVPAGTILYRGTSHHTSVPSRIEEIWFPPADSVTSFGRANGPGRPLFYSCSDPGGAFLEIGTTGGQYVVLSEWRARCDFLVHEVGYSARVLERAQSKRTLPARHVAFYSETIPNQESYAAREYLSLAFTNPTATHYRVSAAIADMCMACDEIVGVMYPAVAISASVDNLALFPQFVRSGMELVAATLYHVDEIAVTGMKSRTIATLASGEDGNLAWNYPSPLTPIAPGASAAVFLRPGQKQRLASTGRIIVEGRSYSVLPGYAIELDGDDFVVRDLQGRIVAPE